MAEDRPKGWRHERSRESASKSPPVLVRFTDENEIVWTVWDTAYTKFKNHRRAHCDPDAKERVFVNGAGVRRSYTFKKRESRALDPQFLERQLRESGFVGKMPDTKSRTPW